MLRELVRLRLLMPQTVYCQNCFWGLHNDDSVDAQNNFCTALLSIFEKYMYQSHRILAAERVVKKIKVDVIATWRIYSRHSITMVLNSALHPSRVA